MTALSGIAARAGSVLLFVSSDVCAKHLAELGHSVWQLVFAANVIALAPVGYALKRSGGLAALRSRKPLLQGLRTVLGLGGMTLFFAGLAHLPLTDAVTLGFTQPVLVTVLAALVLGERARWQNWAALVLGAIGVAIVLRPGAGVVQLGALFILASVACASAGNLVLRVLAVTDPPAATAFWCCLGVALATGTIMLATGVRVPGSSWEVLLLLGLGLMSGTAQFLMSLALKLAPVAVIAPIQYLALPISAVYSWLIWQHAPDAWGWLGAAIIVAAGALTLFSGRAR
jgi:drug/metabolite transporter (DMT)-like permease